MVRLGTERVLLIGDQDRRVQSALQQADPAAQITTVPDYFDAIAELHKSNFSSILASVEPIERRPEAAVKTLRSLAGRGRLVLFGQASYEPLSRKMLEFGCDDYLISPINSAELQKMFGAIALRLAPAPAAESTESHESDTAARDFAALLQQVHVPRILLEALAQQPLAAITAAVAEINRRLSPAGQLFYQPSVTALPASPQLADVLVQPVRFNESSVFNLILFMPQDQPQSAARHFLSQLADLLVTVGMIQDRYLHIHRQAFTDELTKLKNKRYFDIFLKKIIDWAKLKRLPVTLLMFDLDNFKHYNDQYGHAMGDEVLRQTAALMKRCCREHDIVARLGGDEFAVIFWEKEGPRQPRDNPPQPTNTSARALQTPMQIFNRFTRLLATQAFQNLGPGGKGTLTASGGIAVYPFDANTPESLKKAADESLMFGAKKSGKNTIFLVGGDASEPKNG